MTFFGLIKLLRRNKVSTRCSRLCLQLVADPAAPRRAASAVEVVPVVDGVAAVEHAKLVQTYQARDFAHFQC